MKHSIRLLIVCLLMAWMPNLVLSGSQREMSPDQMLKGLDAKQALAIANQWKWSRKGIKSYINTREVVFQFPDGRKTRIPLPENEVMIAVAPYVKKTHE